MHIVRLPPFLIIYRTINSNQHSQLDKNQRFFFCIILEKILFILQELHSEQRYQWCVLKCSHSQLSKMMSTACWVYEHWLTKKKQKLVYFVVHLPSVLFIWPRRLTEVTNITFAMKAKQLRLFSFNNYNP